MKDLDDEIKAKQAEVKRLVDEMAACPISHERSPGEPVVMNSSEDLTRFSILRRRREIAERECDILLHEKYPDRMPINLEATESEIADLKAEIEVAEKELNH